MRIEEDYLGQETLPDEVYYGAFTQRAGRYFNVSGSRWQRVFILSLAQVKEACLTTTRDLGYLDREKAAALLQACQALQSGDLDQHIIVDPLQGGAGTATNFNINEVLANKALEIMGYDKGRYDIIHPLEDANRFQSTNDVFPTAARVAVLYTLHELQDAVTELQTVLQEKEQAYAGLVKVGRTQLQSAVPVSLGMEFGSWAEAVARDRWRIFKSSERLKVVNLGGTAVGTGISAPRDYIFRVTDQLRKITGLNLARAENLTEATANADVFAEVSGIMRSHAANLIKIGHDLRFLASDICGELQLPPLVRGSSIMPGKVNPVIPELMVQVGLRVLGHDSAIVQAVASGSLELNPFMPLIAYSMIESMQLLTSLDQKTVRYCLREVQANHERIQENLLRSQALVTALLPHLGYQKAENLWHFMQKEGVDVRQANRLLGFMEPDHLDALLNPRQLLKLGEVTR